MTVQAQQAFAFSPRELSRGGLASWQMRRIRALADQRLPELTVTLLAAEVGLSLYHFSRSFRASFGVTPSAWLAERKLARAMEQLLEPGRTVDAVAVELGYYSGSQLARLFRRRIGSSPARYRIARLAEVWGAACDSAAGEAARGGRAAP